MVSTSTLLELHLWGSTKGHPKVFDFVGHGFVDYESNCFTVPNVGITFDHYCQEIEEIRSELKTAKKDMELRQNEFFGLDGVGERETRKQPKPTLVGKVQV